MVKDTGNEARNAMFDHAVFLKDVVKYDPKHIRESLVEIAVGVAIHFHNPKGATRKGDGNK
jgi:hypothetical protein